MRASPRALPGGPTQSQQRNVIAFISMAATSRGAPAAGLVGACTCKLQATGSHSYGNQWVRRGDRHVSRRPGPPRREWQSWRFLVSLSGGHLTAPVEHEFGWQPGSGCWRLLAIAGKAAGRAGACAWQEMLAEDVRTENTAPAHNHARCDNIDCALALRPAQMPVADPVARACRRLPLPCADISRTRPLLSVSEAAPSVAQSRLELHLRLRRDP